MLAGEAVLDSEPSGVTPQCRTVIEAALLATMLDSKDIAPVVKERVQALSLGRWAIPAL